MSKKTAVDVNSAIWEGKAEAATKKKDKSFGKITPPKKIAAKKSWKNPYLNKVQSIAEAYPDITGEELLNTPVMKRAGEVYDSSFKANYPKKFFKSGNKTEQYRKLDSAATRDSHKTMYKETKGKFPR